MTAEIRPRKALNCLQYNDSNIKSIVGLSNQSLKTNQSMDPKKALLSDTNEKLNKLKKRNSISLPDINLLLNGESLSGKSSTRTPTSKPMKKMTASKSNISVIYEDKENPKLMRAKLDKMKNMENKIGRKLAVNKALREAVQAVQTSEMSVQCNKAEEDMVFGDSVRGTDYWRLIAYKRNDALVETQAENKMLHSCIESLNKKNEDLRQNIKELYELIDQYKELQRAALEEAEENDAVDDSGFDL